MIPNELVIDEDQAKNGCDEEEERFVKEQNRSLVKNQAVVRLREARRQSKGKQRGLNPLGQHNHQE